MSKVRIIHIAAPTPQGYRWRWRTEDGTVASKRAFDLFYECMADARAKGYEVRLGPPPACIELYTVPTPQLQPEATHEKSLRERTGASHGSTSR